VLRAQSERECHPAQKLPRRRRLGGNGVTADSAMESCRAKPEQEDTALEAERRSQGPHIPPRAERARSHARQFDVSGDVKQRLGARNA
jgi:hypothetical protein